MHNYQKAVTAELLASMSPIIFAQNQCLLSYISEEFDIPLEILKKKTNPKYLDFVSVYINKEKTSLSTVFPEMKVLTPKKDQCLARIKSGDHTHQCPHPCKDGKFCSSHKTKRSWGTVDQPFVCSQQSIIMKLQSSEKVKAKKEKIVEEQEEVICEEWNYKDTLYYWDPNTNNVYDTESNIIGIRTENTLQRIDN